MIQHKIPEERSAMLRRIVLLIMALAALVFAIGCSSTSTPAPSATTDNTAQTDEFGGYTTDPEEPAFGDSTLVAAEDTEVEVNDAIVEAASVAALIGDSESGLFRFRALWGQLQYDSTHTILTDWTGSLTASRGALVIRRLIAFELNQDGYFPRENPETVSWFSFTSVHHDGIEVEFWVRPADPVIDTTVVVDTLGDTVLVVDTLPVEPVTLTFATGPYTRTFTLPELAALDTVVALDDGNTVVLKGMQIIRNSCPRGIVVGQWGHDKDSNGVFQGEWRDRTGCISGYVRGSYTEDSIGTRKFFGKWINMLGQCQGLIRGTWGPNPNDNGNDIARQRAGGWFIGSIFDSNGDEIGSLSGKYKAAPRFPAGWFEARWKLTCTVPDMGDPMEIFDDGL
jgi:hypothetical protein